MTFSKCSSIKEGLGAAEVLAEAAMGQEATSPHPVVNILINNNNTIMEVEEATLLIFKKMSYRTN